MEIYTIQLAKHRLARKLGIKITDSTVKSGDKRLAPTWEMVMGHKNGMITNDEYEERYRKLMRESQLKHPEFWDSLLEQKVLCIACFCSAYTFCHRHILASLLIEYGLSKSITVTIKGEIVHSPLKPKE